MSGHIYAKEGTAAASPGTTVDILGDAGFTARQVLVQNTHASLALTLAGLPTVNDITMAAGQSLLIPGNVQRFRVVEATAAATFKVLASDSAAPSAEVHDLQSGTAAIADGSVTTAKLADDALSADAAGRGKMADDYYTDVEVSTVGAGGKFAPACITGPGVAHLFDNNVLDATNVAQLFATDSIDVTNAADIIANSAITNAHLAAGAVTPAKTVGSGTLVAGSVAVPQVGVAVIADGANEIELVIPIKSVLAFASCVKSGAGGAGDEIRIRTATGGGGNLIASFDLSTAADTDTVMAGINAVNASIAAGASIFVLGVVGAASNAGMVTITCVPVV